VGKLERDLSIVVQELPDRNVANQIENQPPNIRPNSQELPRVSIPVDASLPLSSNPLKTGLGLSDISPPLQSHELMQTKMGLSIPAIAQRPPEILNEPHGYPSPYDIDFLGNQTIRVETARRVEWDQIQQLRIDNWSLRSQIHEMRASLREKQDILAMANDMLSRRMNRMLSGQGITDPAMFVPKGQKNLDELKQDCQDARDAYGPLEDDCNRLEDQLSEQEFRLTRLEREFYSTRQEPSAPLVDPPVYPLFQRTASPSPSYHEDEIEESEYHPLVTKYLSRMGDLDLLLERRVELVEEKEALEEKKESRLRFGLTLDPDDLDWLETSQSVEEDLIEKIKQMEKELEDMKRTCIDQGLVDEDGEPTSFQNRELVSFKGEVDPQDHKSEYVKYPLLLPPPGRKIQELEGYEPRPDNASDPITIRINVNEWMLHRLRSSPLDVNLLARTFEGKHGQIIDDWQIAVLSLWYRDGTVESEAGFAVYPSSVTAISPLSNHSLPISKSPGW
jgi:hypothetical protein